MAQALLSGFFISLSLILAIGPQNSLVIRQGLANQYVLMAVLFCALSDAFLICLGVLGLGRIMAPIFTLYADWLFGLSALWLIIYAAGRLKEAFFPIAPADLTEQTQPVRHRLSVVLSSLAILTFANPHVYLDTVILIGTLSLPYHGGDKIAFAFGASMASLSFFCLLGFGARKFHRYMVHRRAWQYLDIVTATVMIVFAVILIAQISLFA